MNGRATTWGVFKAYAFFFYMNCSHISVYPEPELYWNGKLCRGSILLENSTDVMVECRIKGSLSVCISHANKQPKSFYPPIVSQQEKVLVSFYQKIRIAVINI